MIGVFKRALSVQATCPHCATSNLVAKRNAKALLFGATTTLGLWTILGGIGIAGAFGAMSGAIILYPLIGFFVYAVYRMFPMCIHCKKRFML